MDYMGGLFTIKRLCLYNKTFVFLELMRIIYFLKLLNLSTQCSVKTFFFPIQIFDFDQYGTYELFKNNLIRRSYAYRFVSRETSD